MARVTPSWEARTPGRSGFELLAWGLSLTLHCAAVAALCWNAPPAANGVPEGSSREKCIELFDGSAFQVQSAAEESVRVQPAAFLTSTTIHATLEPPPDLLPATIPAPQHFQELPPPSPAPATASASQGEADPIGSPNDFGVETQVFGVRGKGQRFVYVFDRSASMEGRPLEAAKRELIGSLRRLKSIHQFQIIFYNQQPQVMPLFRGRSPQMAFGDEQGQRLAALFVGGIFADGGTDHIQALNLALGMKPDVIFFLTDANEPRLSADDLREIRRRNPSATINTIEFGVGPPIGSYNFLQQLAAENRGQHAYVDVTRLGAGQ
jgi:hypothetical protein